MSSGTKEKISKKAMNEMLSNVVNLEIRESGLIDRQNKISLELARVRGSLSGIKSDLANENLPVDFPCICKIQGISYLFERKNGFLKYTKLLDIPVIEQ